jgi:diadenosine tetraphosphate (Ap4A) HIT family hydrolase
MYEMSLVAEAAANAFCAEKMNYELLGMGDAHLHWHLFPRREGDIGTRGNMGKGPVWCMPFEEMYAECNRPTDEELADMKQKLLTELDKLT